jgi:hypothetical protein
MRALFDSSSSQNRVMVDSEIFAGGQAVGQGAGGLLVGGDQLAQLDHVCRFLVEGAARRRQFLGGAAQAVGQAVAVGLGRRFRIKVGDRFRYAVAQRAKMFRNPVARSNPSHSSCCSYQCSS